MDSDILKELDYSKASKEITVQRFQDVNIIYDIDENSVTVSAKELIELLVEYKPEVFL